MNGVGLHMTRAFAPQAAPTRRSSLSKMPNAQGQVLTRSEAEGQ